MINGLLAIENSLGVSFEIIVTMLVVLGSIFFMARKFELGLIMGMALSILVGMWFYVWNLSSTTYINFQIPLIVGLMYLILLSLSLFFNNTSTVSVD